MSSQIPAAYRPAPTGAEWTAYGVRWTNELGEIAIHQCRQPWIARPLMRMLRRIQAERGATPDAGVVTRRMWGYEPIGAWTAAPAGEVTP